MKKVAKVMGIALFILGFVMVTAEAQTIGQQVLLSGSAMAAMALGAWITGKADPSLDPTKESEA